MDIVFVTAELAPYRESSYAARSAAACAKALKQLGHKVTVLAPLFSDIDPGARHLARRLSRVEVELGDGRTHFAIYEGKTAGGVDLVLFGHPDLFGTKELVLSSHDASPPAARRWGAFCRAATQWIGQRETLPDVVQLYGWQTAPIALVAKDDPALERVPTVLAVHDLVEAGAFERSALSEYGIAPRYFAIEGVEFYGRFSALKAGLVYAKALVVPGPTFARTLAEPGGAGGLDGAFRARSARVAGIVEGVDGSVWNAATDPHLEVRYDAMSEALAARQGTPTGKARNQAALLAQLGLPPHTGALLAYAGRAEDAESLAAILPKIVRNEVLVVVALEGVVSDEVRQRWDALAARWQGRVHVRCGADTALVHRLLAAADLVAVPGEHAAATRALEAHRYGALPIAVRFGLAADAVVDADAELRSGNGFLVDGAGETALLEGVQRGLAAFALGAPFHAMQVRAMQADHGWDRPARLFERLYRSLGAEAPRPAVTA
jgi:starch synthase